MMRSMTSSAALVGVSLAIVGVGAVTSPSTASAICAPILVDEQRTYVSVINVGANAVSRAPIITMTIPPCDDTPASGRKVTMASYPLPPGAVLVHGIRGVPHRIAVATPVRATSKPTTSLVYVRPNVCRTVVRRGTARFLACLRAYSRRTA